MSACGYCGIDFGARPYARAKDKAPSVTAIAELVDDGKSRGFAWSASLIATTLGVHERQRWADMGTDGCTHDKDGLCPACRYVRSEFDRQWKDKAVLGNHVHHLVQSMIDGEDVDQDERVAPYLDAFEKFVVECEPEFEISEATILYDSTPSHRYRGTLDAIATIVVPGTTDRRRMVLDWKTGGFHPFAQTLQLSAYAYAEWITDWTDGTESKVRPVPKVSGGAVVLLAPDGRFTLAELPILGDTFGTFVRLVDVWRHVNTIKQWVKQHPLPQMEDK